MRRLAKPMMSVPLAAALFTGVIGSAMSAPPSDWTTIPTTTVKLFYPGQSSYQWLRSSGHKCADKEEIEPRQSFLDNAGSSN